MYVGTEIQLLRWIIFVFKEPILDKDGHCVFNFDKPQIDALTGLIASLRTQSQLRTVSKWVVEALHRLYFPSQPNRSAFNTFAEPVSVFFALQSLMENTAPRPLEEIPPLCARLQFSMRLRGYHHLFTDFTATYDPRTVETLGLQVVSHLFIDIT